MPLAPRRGFLPLPVSLSPPPPPPPSSLASPVNRPRSHLPLWRSLSPPAPRSSPTRATPSPRERCLPPLARAATAPTTRHPYRIRPDSLPRQQRPVVPPHMPTPRTIKTASRILHAGEAVAANPWFDDAPDDPPSPPRVAFVNPRSGDYLGPVRALAELHDALIWALVGSASPQLALPIYARVVPTLHTLPSLLESLALSAVVPGAHHFALTVHAHCVKLGLAGFLLVNNALILAHACLLGCLSDALLLLRIASSVDASTFNTLIMAHARAGPVADARALFDEMPTRNVVSWSAMVNGKRTLGMISLMPLYVDQSLYKMPVMR